MRRPVHFGNGRVIKVIVTQDWSKMGEAQNRLMHILGVTNWLKPLTHSRGPVLNLSFYRVSETLFPATVPTVYIAKTTDKDDIEKHQIPELKLLQRLYCK